MQSVPHMLSHYNISECLQAGVTCDSCWLFTAVKLTTFTCQINMLILKLWLQYSIHYYNAFSTLHMQKGLFQLVVAIHSSPFYMDREGKKLSASEWQLFQKIIFLKSLTLRVSEPQESIKAFMRQVSCSKLVLACHVKSSNAPAMFHPFENHNKQKYFREQHGHITEWFVWMVSVMWFISNIRCMGLLMSAGRMTNKITAGSPWQQYEPYCIDSISHLASA